MSGQTVELLAIEERLDSLDAAQGGLATRIDALTNATESSLLELAEAIDSIKPAQPDRAELFTALAEAQKQIVNAEHDAEADAGSYQYKYATLAAVLNAVRGPLADNGLSLIQITDDPGQGMLGIRTILAHSSGQTISDHITMSPPKMDPQGIGSCRTYMRRYAAMAICGIAGAHDDDAEATKVDPDDYERITAKEADQILYKADELFDDRADEAIAKMLERVFGVSHVSEIKAGEATVAITNLENARKLMDKRVKKGADDKPSPEPPEKKDREPGEDDE